MKAGCSLAEAITRDDVKALKAKYPGVPVVTYVNCSAEVKAETDVCCTSANALQIVNAVEGDTVIFLPDEYLAGNVRNQTSKTIISHPGRCMVHEMYTPEDIRSAKRLFSGNLTVITHPECHEDVVKEADFSGSTSQMVDFIRQSKTNKIMLVTECSMGDNLRAEFPEKEFVSTCQTCPHMKKITLEKVRDALLKEQFEIFLDEEVIRLAQKSVNRMLELSYKK